jgi:hypothetical protein
MDHMRKLILVLVVALSLGFRLFATDECRHDEQAVEPGHSCSATCAKAGKEVVSTTENALLVGTMLCGKCDLKRSDKCEKVLTTAEQRVYVLCPNSLEGKDLTNMSRKQVEVRGTVFGIQGGDSVIHVNEIALKPSV